MKDRMLRRWRSSQRSGYLIIASQLISAAPARRSDIYVYIEVLTGRFRVRASYTRYFETAQVEGRCRRIDMAVALKRNTNLDLALSVIGHAVRRCARTASRWGLDSGQCYGARGPFQFNRRRDRPRQGGQARHGRRA